MKPIISEFETNLSAAGCFEKFKDDDHAFFLDSAMSGEKLGRFSFLGSQPFLVMKSRGKAVRLSSTDGQRRLIEADPFDVLRDILHRYHYDTNSTGIPFSGGAVSTAELISSRKSVNDSEVNRCASSKINSNVPSARSARSRICS